MLGIVGLSFSIMKIQALNQMVSKTLPDIKNTTNFPKIIFTPIFIARFVCFFFYSENIVQVLTSLEFKGFVSQAPWCKHHKTKMLKMKRLGQMNLVLKIVIPIVTHVEIN